MPVLNRRKPDLQRFVRKFRRETIIPFCAGWRHARNQIPSLRGEGAENRNEVRFPREYADSCDVGDVRSVFGLEREDHCRVGVSARFDARLARRLRARWLNIEPSAAAAL